ncbi:MAG: hypothetical protein AMR96_05025 [Candidatus Adiutrix intracellularis]|nr:MAG: hypothetical protein AMR96_05025 [Candidatus Adiutrix intracellularis]
MTSTNEEVEIKEHRSLISPAGKIKDAQLKTSGRKKFRRLPTQSFKNLLLSLVSIRLNSCQLVNRDT